MFTCRGPRVLPDHLYKRVVDYVVAGDYASARKILSDFLLVPRSEDFDEYLATADTRSGCGRDLTEFLGSVGSGTHVCPCGRLRIAVLRGDDNGGTAQPVSRTSFWERVRRFLGW